MLVSFAGLTREVVATGKAPSTVGGGLAPIKKFDICNLRSSLLAMTSSDNASDGEFPLLTPDYILAFQFSSWYPLFARFSPRSTIVRPLGKDFKDYLDSDGVFVPEGSEDVFVPQHFRPVGTNILHLTGITGTLKEPLPVMRMTHAL